MDDNKGYVNLIKNIPEHTSPPTGEPQGICEVCGCTFDQIVFTETNKYTEFRKCPKCRRTKKGDDPAADAIVMQITLDYTPHSKSQQDFHDSTARFRVLSCGSRWGKDRATTMEAIPYFIACLNEERGTDMIPSVYWWIVAPTERMSKQNWNELKRYFPKELVRDISNSGMTLSTIYGGTIEVRSAYDPESLVGVGLDIVTITEAARIADLDIVWGNLEQRLNSPHRGLDGNGGIGIINSSPKGRTYFYKMWCWGQESNPNYDPDWESWTNSTWDNPEMEKRGQETKSVRGRLLTYKERLKRRLGTNRYNQDILALFLAGETKCFPTFMEKCVQYPPDVGDKERQVFINNWKQPENGATYVISYDPAKVNDYPAVFVIDEANGHLKEAYNLTGLNWTAQYKRLSDISRKYNFAPVAFSQTGHMTIQEALEERGIQCIVFNEQGSNKENFVTHYEAVIENGGIQILEDGSDIIDEIIRQHNDYARIQSGKTIVFGNVDEPHDDFVDCGYIAFQAVTTVAETLPFIGLVRSAKRHG